MNKFILKTMGCKANQFESAVIEEKLLEEGFIQTKDLHDANFFILNSCTVTHKSDNEALYMLRNAKHTNPEIKTVITGCLAQVDKDNLIKSDYIDFIFGNDEKFNIAKSLKENTSSWKDIMIVDEFHNVSLLSTTKTRASLKIQDGCNNRCSYCIIPFARGKNRSAKPEFLLEQIKSFEQMGFKELVITGIHIGQWGKDFNSSLIELLKIIEQNCSIRYRLGSLNPLELDDELIDFLAQSELFCPHFHLSLQSACDRTLKRMNRHYSVEDEMKVIDKITKKFNKPFLGSDIIAGFVGESEEDFQITLKNLENSSLTAIHTFPYSIRKNTVAANMDGHLSDDIKNSRATAIKEISARKTQEFLNNNINSEHKVLIEKHLDKKTGYIKGVSENYIKVIIKNNDDLNLANTIQKVLITKISGNEAFGKIIN